MSFRITSLDTSFVHTL